MKTSSTIFWSWNEKLDKKTLLEGLTHLKESGIGGFFMHARGGLKTEYMGEEWFDAIEFCIEQGNAMGLEPWIYDENGWPSGFANGKLLKEGCYLQDLQVEYQAAFDKTALGNYVQTPQGWKYETEERLGEKYLVIRVRTNKTYVDLLNQEIAKEFTRLVYRPYKERFGNRFVGFFTDEPQYSREGIPWSRVLPARFAERYGYSMVEKLYTLFVDTGEETCAFRFAYWSLVSELYLQSIRVLYEWCDANGYLLTGHTIDENYLYGQMLCSGGVMPFYEYEHIPGIDWLTRWHWRDLLPKQCTSVARQLGKKVVLSESFAGGGWGTTPKDLKRIADFQFTSGVSRFCYHLYPCSIAGERKRDWPPFFSKHNAWMKDSKEFHTYVEDMGALIAEGDEVCDVLVLHPMTSAYLYFDRYDEMSLVEIQKRLDAVGDLLADAQIGYHFGDESLMAKYARVEGKCFIVGECRYHYLVLPGNVNLCGSTYALLRTFLQNGGKVYIHGEKPRYLEGKPNLFADIESTCTLEDIAKTRAFYAENGKDLRLFTVRKEGKTFFIVQSHQEKGSMRKVCADVPFAEYDILQKKVYAVSQKQLYFEPWQTRIFVTDCAEEARLVGCKKERLDLSFQVQTGENTFVLDKFTVKTDKDERVEFLPQTRRRLLQERYEGKVRLSTMFHNKNHTQGLRLMIEPLPQMRVRLNGKACDKQLPAEWKEYVELDLTDALQIGENTLEISLWNYQREEVYDVLFTPGVLETLKNKLTYDTEIENCMLVGNFGVSASTIERVDEKTCRVDGFQLEKMAETLQANAWIESGFPFAYKPVRLEKTMNCEGNLRLRCQHSFQEIRVFLNGEYKGVFLLQDCVSLGRVSKGDRLTLEVVPGLKNLFGQHHTENTDIQLSCPESFDWIEREDYAVMRYGISLLEIEVTE